MRRVKVVIHGGWPENAKWIWAELFRVYGDCQYIVAGKNPLEMEFTTWAEAVGSVAEKCKLIDCDVVAVLHQRLFAAENSEERERRLFERALREIGHGGTVDHWYFTPGIDDSKVCWRFVHRPKPERDGGNDCFANLVKGDGNGHHIAATVRAESGTNTQHQKGAGRYGKRRGR